MEDSHKISRMFQRLQLIPSSDNRKRVAEESVEEYKKQPENVDPNLPVVNDPRLKFFEDENKIRVLKVAKKKGGGRNTESFAPESTFVRPSMRIVVGPNREVLGKQIKHDDVIIVPEFFCEEGDWSLYYQLIEEMKQDQERGLKKSEWISWHEGAHLITQNPNGSKSFTMIQARISKYFGINNKTVGTRFNWYRDSSDWKPFHHDSAAFNEDRARNQNITVGVSFGATRELAFLNAKNGSRIYFPQTNGMLFSFGRDVNINWKHGINALPEHGRDGKGRISIILWGLCPNIIEEPESPPMLTDNTRGNGYSMHQHSKQQSSSFCQPQKSDSDRQRSFSDTVVEPHHQHHLGGVQEHEAAELPRGGQKQRREGREKGDLVTEVCRDFKKGRCRHGDRCRFSHDRS